MIKYFMYTRTPEQLSFMMNSSKLHWFFVPAAFLAQTPELFFAIVLMQWIVLAFQILANREITRRMKFMQLQINIVKDVLSVIRRSRNE